MTRVDLQYCGAVTALSAGDIEAIALRVVELLEPPTRKLLTANEVARLLAVDVAFVYAHQHELSVLRLPGAGPRAALRFDRDTILELLRRRTDQPPPGPAQRARKPRRPSPPPTVELLPYEPRSAA